MFCFLKTAPSIYPLLFRIALDVLPVQASSVSSERVFSSSKETCTKRRNRLSPVLVEALQHLKFLFRQQDLAFEEEMPDPDAQPEPEIDEGWIDRDKVAQAMMNGDDSFLSSLGVISEEAM